MSKVGTRAPVPDNAPMCYGDGMNGSKCDTCDVPDECMQEWRHRNAARWKNRV